MKLFPGASTIFTIRFFPSVSAECKFFNYDELAELFLIPKHSNMNRNNLRNILPEIKNS
jgi:hypothetical protein